MASTSGKVGLFTKVNGAKIKLMVKALSGIVVVIFILVSSWPTRLMDLEYTSISTAQDMKVSGSTTSKKVKEKRYGKMVLDTWVLIRKA